MARTHGYSLRGKRCFATQDWGAKGRTNVIGALLEKSLLTVALFSVNVNTALFTCWIEKDLLPKLPKGSVIVMDNATFHKSQAMINTIQKAGHKLEYLPPYSPDLNPIENKWAQAKALRRKQESTIDDLFKCSNL
jgi:transposase